MSATVSPSFTVSPTFTVSPSITQTFTITTTPLPTSTADVPAVTNRNVFRPERGDTLKLDFKASQDGRVKVTVFNLNGELIRPIFEADIQAGLWFQATWDGKNDDGSLVASGIYFISVKGAGIKTIKKVILIK